MLHRQPVLNHSVSWEREPLSFEVKTTSPELSGELNPVYLRVSVRKEASDVIRFFLFIVNREDTDMGGARPLPPAMTEDGAPPPSVPSLPMYADVCKIDDSLSCQAQGGKFEEKFGVVEINLSKFAGAHKREHRCECGTRRTYESTHMYLQ